jgi:hypothetical protein
MGLVEIELGGEIVSDNLRVVEVVDADVDRCLLVDNHRVSIHFDIVVLA